MHHVITVIVLYLFFSVLKLKLVVKLSPSYIIAARCCYSSIPVAFTARAALLNCSVLTSSLCMQILLLLLMQWFPHCPGNEHFTLLVSEHFLHSKCSKLQSHLALALLLLCTALPFYWSNFARCFEACILLLRLLPILSLPIHVHLCLIPIYSMFHMLHTLSFSHLCTFLTKFDLPF